MGEAAFAALFPRTEAWLAAVADTVETFPSFAANYDVATSGLRLVTWKAAGKEEHGLEVFDVRDVFVPSVHRREGGVPLRVRQEPLEPQGRRKRIGGRTLPDRQPFCNAQLFMLLGFWRT